MKFKEKIEAAWTRSCSMLCIGLDPDITKFPSRFQHSINALLEFNKFIIDATGDLVCAFKPQFAHYAAMGAERQLEDTIRYIRLNFPNVIVILDAKRGDIGSTAQMYVREAFDRYDADAVTVNPLMGDDTILPFLERPDRAAIVLCRTSNPSASMLQDREIDGQRLSVLIADRAERRWNANANVMLVVGATSIDEMRAIRATAPSLPFLVPGIGAQGGDPAEVVPAGTRSQGDGLVVSSSRSVLYAGSSAEEIRNAASKLRDQLKVRVAQAE